MVSLILGTNVHCDSYLYFWVLVEVVNWVRQEALFGPLGQLQRRLSLNQHKTRRLWRRNSLHRTLLRPSEIQISNKRDSPFPPLFAPLSLSFSQPPRSLFPSLWRRIKERISCIAKIGIPIITLRISIAKNATFEEVEVRKRLYCWRLD